MAFEQRQAERNLQNVLSRIRTATYSIESDILKYRSNDTITDEDDEYRTMRDIRYYLLRSYREIGDVLTYLDRYN